MPHSPHDDPFAWFDAWFIEASQQISKDPNAMTLSTVSPGGQPASRVVLLKSWDERGFVFYSNRTSRKGQHLEDTPRASLNFWWRPLDRQIRIEGDVEHVDDAESDLYFATRPRLSQIGAWASLQSQELADQATFQERVAATEQRFAGREVERPAHWGGYRVVPGMFEFWRSGDFRLHERWEFRRPDIDSEWSVRMLYP